MCCSVAYNNQSSPFAKMGAEELHLFFHFANVSGLFPFRIILNRTTGKFQRFEGRWRHLVNWWFIFLLIGQVFFVTAFIYMNVTMRVEESSLSFPVFYLVTFSLFLLCQLLFTITPRLFLMNFRHLETALLILRRIDNELIQMSHAPSCGATQRRTLIGIFLTLLMVSNYCCSA